MGLDAITSNDTPNAVGRNLCVASPPAITTVEGAGLDFSAAADAQQEPSVPDVFPNQIAEQSPGAIAWYRPRSTKSMRYPATTRSAPSMFS